MRKSESTLVTPWASIGRVRLLLVVDCLRLSAGRVICSTVREGGSGSHKYIDYHLGAHWASPLVAVPRLPLRWSSHLFKCWRRRSAVALMSTSIALWAPIG